MPNWCYNYTKIAHENPAKIAELKQTLTGDEANTFAHFIPLPDGKWDYDFCINNWGTKWDIVRPEVRDEDANMLDLYFETAWSPPTGVYAAMKKQGYVVKSEYWEEGGFFVGHWIDGLDESFSPEDVPDELCHLVAYTRFDEEEGEAA